jgi:hypothetical protein
MRVECGSVQQTLLTGCSCSRGRVNHLARDTAVLKKMQVAAEAKVGRVVCTATNNERQGLVVEQPGNTPVTAHARCTAYNLIVWATNAPDNPKHWTDIAGHVRDHENQKHHCGCDQQGQRAHA